MTTEMYFERLSKISKTLAEVATRVKAGVAEEFPDISHEDLEHSQQLIADLHSFNLIQRGHGGRGNFIAIGKARDINDRHNERFTKVGTNGSLPLLNTPSFWFIDADRLRMLTNFITKDNRTVKTIRIYPGVVTKAEDKSMGENEERFTFIFAAVDENGLPIRDADLSNEIKEEIKTIQITPVAAPHLEDQFDVLDEIGACKPPAQCNVL